MGKKHASQYANFGWLHHFGYHQRIVEYLNSTMQDVVYDRIFFKCFDRNHDN